MNKALANRIRIARARRLAPDQPVKFRNGSGKVLVGQVARLRGHRVQIKVHSPARYAGQWVVLRTEVV
jgi:hypothetical protein